MIFDRTQDDVDYANTHLDDTDNLKGNYNVSDLNRVETKVRQLTDILTSYGYSVINITKTNWDTIENFTVEDAQRYLGNIQRLINAYVITPSTPTLPSEMEELTFQEANSIEKILYDIDLLIDNMEASFIYCGTFNSGESEGLI